MAALLVPVLLAPAAVLAHAAVEASDPTAGATLPETPVLVTTDFTERLDPGLSSLTLAAPDGTIVATGGVAAGDPEARQMALRPPALGPGVYTVGWTAVSADDGDVANGSYTFTIIVPTPRPSASAAPGATATPATASPATPTPSPFAPASASQGADAFPSSSAAQPTTSPAASPGSQAGETGIGAQPIALAIVLALAVAVAAGAVIANRRRRTPRA